MAAIVPHDAPHRAHGALLPVLAMFPGVTAKFAAPDWMNDEPLPIAIEKTSPVASASRLSRDCHIDDSNASFHWASSFCSSTQLSRSTGLL
jgi:hypothetical protein